MTATGLPPDWRMVKVSEVCRTPTWWSVIPRPIERIIGLEHLDPKNPHNLRWNAVADGKEFAPTTTRTKMTTIGKLP